MGREIEKSHFKARDYQNFARQLKAESALLSEHFATGNFVDHGVKAGLELELWLVDEDFNPAPRNDLIIDALQQPLICPELAKFNIEINTEPLALKARALSRLAQSMQQEFDRLQQCARGLASRALMIGILPTARLSDFCLDNMSQWNRYRALNEQLLHSREGRPLTLEIEGSERLRIEHRNVMLESAATSYQIHLAVPPSELVDHFNASLVVSAPMVAIAANSPLFLGTELWEETRIPLFEQAIQFGDFHGANEQSAPRVSFGKGYLTQSALELFEQNLNDFPILLPINEDHAPQRFSHLRLHNGTIWRWNRVLVDVNEDGTAHLRIEHRPAPAGPSVTDMVANTAFYYGLVTSFSKSMGPMIRGLSFEAARHNFYAAARYGLSAEIRWIGGERMPIRRLILEQLLPQARKGLEALAIEPPEIDHYLRIVEARAESGRTGANWQKQVYRASGHDLKTLTEKYFERQQDKIPVHEWAL